MIVVAMHLCETNTRTHCTNNTYNNNIISNTTQFHNIVSFSIYKFIQYVEKNMLQLAPTRNRKLKNNEEKEH